MTINTIYADKLTTITLEGGEEPDWCQFLGRYCKKLLVAFAAVSYIFPFTPDSFLMQAFDAIRFRKEPGEQRTNSFDEEGVACVNPMFLCDLSFGNTCPYRTITVCTRVDQFVLVKNMN